MDAMLGSKRKATRSSDSLPVKRSKIDHSYVDGSDCDQASLSFVHHHHHSNQAALPQGNHHHHQHHHHPSNQASLLHGNHHHPNQASLPQGHHSDDNDDDTLSCDAPNSILGTSTQPSTPGSLAPSSTAREKKFLCDFPGCDKAYTRPVRLAEHHRSHTNERPFVCTHPGCDKSFLRDSHLKHHIKAKHQDVRDYPCPKPHCEKAFHTGTRLREHIKTHDKPKQDFKCTQFPPCDQEFRKQDTLDRHIQLVHLNEKPFVCDHVLQPTGLTCAARFKTSTHLIGHKDREHSGNRFWCKICSPDMSDLDPRLNPTVFDIAVGFPTYAEMQQHVKTFHPPTCTICQRVCASNRDLKAHMEIQHGDLDDRRNFVCDHPDCGRGFTKKGNLLVHQRTVHAKQKQFVCGDFDIKPCARVPAWDGRGACGRPFGTKASLEEHIRTQHLHLPRSARRTKAGMNEASITSIDPAMHDPQPTHHHALSMLTGVGYEHVRNIACVEPACQYRMYRLYDLEIHLQHAHGWSTIEAIEAVKEREALSGGDFWLGGGDDDDTAADAELAQRLQALDPAGNPLPESWFVNE